MRSIIPVILAGGSGSRLWPLSREEYPKQLLRLTGDGTLLQDTVKRLDGLSRAGHVDVSSPVVSCNEEHRFLILEQLEAIDHPPQRIVLEPCGRNTAPALTAVALTLQSDDDPILLVMPADHVITDLHAFHTAANAAADLANEGFIVTFGIVPTHPDTGYGYIRTGEPIAGPSPDAGASAIGAFVEKPDLTTAEAYMSSGNYLWNSGMFTMRASTWLEAIARHRPDILSACQTSVAAGTTDERFFRVDAEAFESCPSDSIDYAVMEKLTGGSSSERSTDSEASIHAAVIPLDAGWSDVGSWRAILDLSAADKTGNVIHGDVFAHDTANSLVIAGQRLVATVGIEDAIVIETADAVLVANKNHTQDVRQVVDWLNTTGRAESQTHRRVYRPWGDFEQLDAGEGYQVKRLSVKPGAALSLQLHRHRAEHWVVVQGKARVTCGDEVFDLSENESTYIPKETKHRLENPGTETLVIIEMQSGSYLGEDDIQRFEDRYNRTVEPE
jgi:mannose-1-phosphate guanylyltransferase/mannose-6-phosphate isomerase